MKDVIKNYVDKKVQLIKLDIVAIVADIGAEIVSSVVKLICFLLFIFMVNLSAGFFLGELFGNMGYGFLSVAGFYLLLLIVFARFGSKTLEARTKDIIVKLAMKSNES